MLIRFEKSAFCENLISGPHGAALNRTCDMLKSTLMIQSGHSWRCGKP